MLRYPSWGLMLTLLLAAAAPSRAQQKVDFSRDVWPILQSNCFECHGEKKPKGKLRLDSKALATKGGNSGPAIAPGKASDSYLVKRIRGSGGEDRMPLDHPPLSEAQIKTIEQWIN